MTFKHIMVREKKKDHSLVALLLDSYDPKSDAISCINVNTGEHYTYGYHSIHNLTVNHHVDPNSHDEELVTNAITHPSERSMCTLIFSDKFSNPNKKKQVED